MCGAQGSGPAWPAKLRPVSGETYQAGDHAVLREVWNGRVWSVRPVVVVHDGPDYRAMFIPSGTPWKRPRTLDDQMMRVPSGEWTLGNAAWENEVLRISPAGEDYSVALIWKRDWDLYCWYINIEERVRPSPFGFDYMDWALDVVVAPDMGEWRMKDEDELVEFVDAGLFTSQQATHARQTAERAIVRLLAHKPPFDIGWEDWRPNPRWGVPQLPERWE